MGIGIGTTGISSCLRTAIPRFVRIFVPDDAVEFAAEALRVPPVPLLEKEDHARRLAQAPPRRAVVFKNQAYGNIRRDQMALFEGRTITRPIG